MLIKSFVDIGIDVIGGNVSSCLSVKRGFSFVESQTWKLVFFSKVVIKKWRMCR